jgi:UDP-N-acetylmuramoyl-L-alanyl-D-glutamate--2,6-diaminopimelate ligase
LLTTDDFAAAEMGIAPTITSITLDSRNAVEGALFIAITGNKADGLTFIEDAIRRGASAVLVAEEQADSLRELRIPILTSKNVRRSAALLAARFYPNAPETAVAVTGTNGKTSTAFLAEQLWELNGFSAASVGTLGVHAQKMVTAGSLTTPDPITLHDNLQKLGQTGVTHVALEASSHGLDQHRLDGITLKAAAFLNLTRDHLDYHQNEAAYFNAKAILFSKILPEGQTAVLPVDSSYFGALQNICTVRNHKIITFGTQHADLQVMSVTPTAKGQELTLSLFGETFCTFLPLFGTFQSTNILAAMGLAFATGISMDTLIATLPRLSGIKGRMENVSPDSIPFNIFIDYAHTPDALEKALQSLRVHTTGNIHVVFGCGGDRDTGKRPIMGEIAANLADFTIITDDNPRTEDANTIRAEVAATNPTALNIGERTLAIATALNNAKAGDSVLIAGKGHEMGQIVGTVTLPYSDHAAVKQVLGIT